ncbi:L,D-transpeptidase family protein [Aeromonas simiae]|uniref:L,D-transpeptidase family protein n=1 Tax=Aeromonas simiae TaxID=218936 RepID=UPI0005A723F6|nr:L,D-transpeptidase family protein [Aeromonas simiae]MDO2949110.1 L,D-transpeptidase family protein [Aeromonas simiae]MDO2953948.1 L,D-transpeptidase family protein [Aeromonas simiae]MDO2956295.1 L,D-transpeptidase family protein [Aeromonas simiae]
MKIHRLATASLLGGLALASLSAQAIEYPLPPTGSRLIGDNQEYVVPDDGRALEAIAAENQLGLTNLMEANPGVDPFLPKAGSKLVIPHQLILPDAPRDGIVINVAEMRLYYYPKGNKVVEVLPIGIGQLGTDTPENWVTKIERKKEGPTWTPTAKMHAEYAARGEPLPAVWPAGPDNPMGLFALYIGRMYAIHGTNAKFGIGLRVSHGCVRLRNEDIEYLFKKVPVGTRVQFVNQPVKSSVEPGGARYLEVHQPLSRSEAEFNSSAQAPLPMTPALTRFIAHKESDSRLIKQALEQRTGIPTQINPV